MPPICAGIRDSRLPPIYSWSFLQGSKQSDKSQWFSTKLLHLNFKRLPETYVKMPTLSTTVHKDSINNLKCLCVLILGLKKIVRLLYINMQIDTCGQKCTRFRAHTLHFSATQFAPGQKLHFKKFYLTLNIKTCHFGVIIIL